MPQREAFVYSKKNLCCSVGYLVEFLSRFLRMYLEKTFIDLVNVLVLFQSSIFLAPKVYPPEQNMFTQDASGNDLYFFSPLFC